MKRKYSDRANWRRVIHKTYVAMEMADEAFEGYVTLFEIHDIRDPLFRTVDGNTYCIADKGYVWVQHFPKDKHYIVTTMFDAEHRVVQHYIDICKKQGITSQGVPWFDDLFLDVIVLPDGQMFLEDEEELSEALQQGAIRKEDYEFAHRHAERVIHALETGTFPIIKLARKHLDILWNMKHNE